LTELSSCAGCAAKLRPDLLAELLRGLPRVKAKDALVGFDTADDAAVYRLGPKLAVVETVDFFPPVVDDPYAYGQIAAANAMSDIWAMGARALFALNLVAFPKELPLSVLEAILAGGADKATEAGIPVLGGHSIQSPEPKYGMAVTGVVDPRRVITNRGARVGDQLILTKPLGTGIATTAIKRGRADPSLVKRVTKQMATLNQRAGEVFASPKLEVHALTDVTGFGLLGHGLEMAEGSGVRLRLEAAAVPLLPGARDLAAAEVVPGGTRANLAWAGARVAFPERLALPDRLLLADAQTNGGLLAAVRPERAGELLGKLRQAGLPAARVGEVLPAAAGPVIEVA